MTQQQREAAIKAAERLDRFLFFIMTNSPIDEEWKELYWLDSNYFISNKGRVLSLCNKEPIILRAFNCNGYYCVSIAGRDRKIHRLVAKSFLDNPDNKLVVHHKNHNKADNSIDNLEWATYKENTNAYLKYKQEKKDQEKREAAAE